MGDKTKIEWADASWNCVRGCTRVSEGCRNCYAEVMAARFSKPGQWGNGYAEMKGGDHRWTGKVSLVESQVDLPLRWQKPRRIFVNSTSDIFHESLPFEQIDKIFAVMALATRHDYLILTKRAERMHAYMTGDRAGSGVTTAGLIRDMHYRPDRYFPHRSAFTGDGERFKWPLRHVWLGVSVEDQERADERIPHLLATPAAVRFISAEPLLGPIDLNAVMLDWVIVGGESGPGARPMREEWVRRIRDQCAAAFVPFFFKQVGGVNKKAAGRLLDGREHNGFPERTMA